jgi:hypothetical protein
MYIISELVVDTITRNEQDSPDIESRWGVGFVAHVQTGPGAHPASCTVGTLSLSGGKALALTAHPHQVPLLPQLTIVACYKLNFPISCL